VLSAAVVVAADWMADVAEAAVADWMADAVEAVAVEGAAVEAAFEGPTSCSVCFGSTACCCLPVTS